MCVNSLCGKIMYKKAADNLAVLDFCINTHTHTHTILPIIIKQRQAAELLLRTIGRNFHCGPLLCILFLK